MNLHTVTDKYAKKIRKLVEILLGHQVEHIAQINGRIKVMNTRKYWHMRKRVAALLYSFLLPSLAQLLQFRSGVSQEPRKAY